MRRVRAGWKSLAILAVALACAVVSASLPDNPYQRWQLLNGTIHARAGWIYERVHYDPRPIDVMFVGPSRVEAAINAPQLEQALAARGVRANVVNFALPETGRNINAEIVAETFKAKRPKLIVIGVIEKPSRYGHSAFKYIAPAWDVVDPGYIGDLNYGRDLIYLPYRQLTLFGARIAPAAFGLPARFDPTRYRGESVNTTGDILLPDGQVKNGTVPASAAELDRGVRKLEAGMNPPLLPAGLADVEFGDERHNIRRIAALARAHGAKLVFVALPYYTGPSTVQERRFYEQFGPLWTAAFLSPRADLFADYAHVTATGATVVTDWLAPKVATQLEPGR